MAVKADVDRISSSYCLTLSIEQIDAMQFRQLCADVQSRAGRGDLEGASRTARRALDLWSGEALEDVRSDALAPAATSLEEMRVGLIEKYGQIELARGNNAGVVVEFSGWVTRYPYHESLHGYLALAMHHMGRTAEGLQVLQSLRSRLRMELGIETGAFVEKVHRGLLDSHQAVVPHEGGLTVGADVLQLVRSALDQLAIVAELLSSSGDCRSIGSSPPAHTSRIERRSTNFRPGGAGAVLPWSGRRGSPDCYSDIVVAGEGTLVGS
ncbi:AfsR/SARP family transcriptional regulator [Micromonospora sp. NPDC051296]|uniref:AfsR/SARP family transcriptional regulator n=1 Tax=Micromonospora sp. NPDC051296 TaxID=3155046 RepID=UPI00343557A5